MADFAEFIQPPNLSGRYRNIPIKSISVEHCIQVVLRDNALLLESCFSSVLRTLGQYMVQLKEKLIGNF